VTVSLAVDSIVKSYVQNVSCFRERTHGRPVEMNRIEHKRKRECHEQQQGRPLSENLGSLSREGSKEEEKERKKKER